MDITSILGLNSNQQNVQRAGSGKLQAVIDTIVSNKRASQAADDVASISTATRLQSDESGLKQVSVQLAEASSLTQVAADGLDSIENALETLQALASKAADPSVDDAARAALNEQFQKAVKTIDDAVSNTSFDGKPLLDGALSGEASLSLEETLTGSKGNTDDITLSIGDLSSTALLGEDTPSLANVESAQSALTIVNSALKQVVGTSEAIQGFQEAANIVAAYVDSVTANQQAAQSVLQDADFTQQGNALANIQGNTNKAIAAQGNLLNPALLNLVG